MIELYKRIHHLFYALAGLVAVVGSVALVVFFWPHHTAVVAGTVPAQANVVAAPGSVAREVQAYIEGSQVLANARSPVVPSLQMPAINVVMPAMKGFSSAEVGALLTAAGHQKTEPVIHVAVVGPSPGPAATKPPDISEADAAFHHQDTYNATAEAIAATQVQVHVTQDPVPPSRISSVFLANHQTGISYALRRRGQADLDVGIVQAGGQSSPLIGFGYRLKGTQAGALIGLTLSKGKPKAAAGFTVSF